MKFSPDKLSIIALLLLSTAAYAEGGFKDGKNLNKTASNPWPYTHMTINNVTTIVYANGVADVDSNTSDGKAGFIYPKGTTKTVANGSGLIWGGIVNEEKIANGSKYNSGLRPGKILPGGTPEDPAKARIYRVRRDYKTASLFTEIECSEGTESEVRNRYDKDWKEWPASDGAPYEDVNHDGQYDPEIDIPGEPGADQTVWFAANDLDEKTSRAFFGSKPIGIEMQCTVFAYRNPGSLKNMIFKRYKLINKSIDTVKNMYTMVWGDFDIGDKWDDFAGCDSLLNLGYCYNAQSSDNIYGNTPPAAGFVLLQGPAVEGSLSDTAYLNGRKIPGMKNLSTTSVSYLIMRDDWWQFEPPHTGDWAARYHYLFMQGYMYWILSYFPVPSALGGGVTKFPYSGDPAKKTGYLDGILYPRGDRCVGLNSGPFNFAPGDTQEVVFAEIAAGGTPGVDYLQAVTLLKDYAGFVKDLFRNGREYMKLVDPPALSAEGYDRQIVLNWGGDQAGINKTENYNFLSYKFEGYNVYQLPYPGAKISDGKRLAVFDIDDSIKNVFGKVTDWDTGVENIVPQQFGTDSGIQRYLKITEDAFTNFPLVNGKKYYYAVTAYAVDPDKDPSNLEGIPVIIEAVPHTNDPGVVYNSSFGDTLQVSHTSGKSGGRVVALVIEPGKLTGDEYSVEFDTLNGLTQWKVIDLTKNKTLLGSQTAHKEKDGYPIIDGILIKVISPSYDVKPDDKFTFKSTAPSFDGLSAKIDVDRINVFPNPYYGGNSQEFSRYQKYVTFNHLPVKATIRIFNLAGQLVRTIYKDTPGQFATWDLLNEHNFQAASGLYVVYIDMPDLGKTKILKLAVIQEQIVPERY
ncbi:MAG TPA: T9SS type A sorting domain-containing protein [Ignavibacteriales bacterium]|nr:T9SS type A sorting domain-containing protein [Ignavibacteriales bacterium]